MSNSFSSSSIVNEMMLHKWRVKIFARGSGWHNSFYRTNCRYLLEDFPKMDQCPQDKSYLSNTSQDIIQSVCDDFFSGLGKKKSSINLKESVLPNVGLHRRT